MDGWTGLVIIGDGFSKSTFGANKIVDILDVTSEKYALSISSQMFQLENGSALLVDSEINNFPIPSVKESEEVANVLQI